MDTIQAAFEQFHLDNPHVFRTLETLTNEWLERHSAVGIGMLWEVMRWRVGIDTTGDQFKLNNNFRSRYARLLIDRHPEWDGRITMRSLVAA